MPNYNTQTISIAADVNDKDNALDASTGAEPECYWARDLTIRCALFSDAGVTILGVADLESATIYIKDPSNLDGAPLYNATVTAFDNTTTTANWAAGTNQHFQFVIPADSLSFSLTNGARLVHLSVVLITAGGQTGTAFVTTMNVIDDGGNAPASNPVNAITVAQAEAMVAALAWSGGVIALAAAGNVTVSNNQTWLLGRQPFSAAVGAGVYAANLLLSDANALAGALLRIPIDFGATLNPTINIYDNSTAGTLLQTIANIDANARSFLFTASFDGTAWHKENGVWVM